MILGGTTVKVIEPAGVTFIQAPTSRLVNVPSVERVSVLTPRASIVNAPVSSPNIVVPVIGPPGSTSIMSVTRRTGQILSGHRAVVPDDDGELIYADNTIAGHANRATWLTTGAWGDGELATVVSFGPVSEPSWAWTPGLPLFVGADGFLVQTLDSGAAFYRRVGEAVTADSIFFDPDQPLVL